jgi:hypothetical protein
MNHIALIDKDGLNRQKAPRVRESHDASAVAVKALLWSCGRSVRRRTARALDHSRLYSGEEAPLSVPLFSTTGALCQATQVICCEFGSSV